MASREPSARAKKSVSLSVILGTLLVPLSAFAASNLVESTAAPGTSITAASFPCRGDGGDRAGPVLPETWRQRVARPGWRWSLPRRRDPSDDLQQAALDALRGVCAEQGTPLPTPPTTQTVVSTAVPAPLTPPPRRSIRSWSHWMTPTTGTITAVTGMTITTMTVTTTTERITIEPVLDPRCHRVGRAHRPGSSPFKSRPPP